MRRHLCEQNLYSPAAWALVASLKALKSFPLTPSVVKVAADLVPRLAIRAEEAASRANIAGMCVVVISYR